MVESKQKIQKAGVNLKSKLFFFRQGLWFVLVTALVTPMAFAQTEKEPVKVFVTAATRTSMDKSELKASVQTTEEAFKELDGELKAQFGEKFEDWPIDKKIELQDAGNAVTYAQVRLILADAKKKHIHKIIEDVKKNFAGKGIMSRKKKFVEVVESQEQADLVVEIAGRYGGLGFMRGNKNICFNLIAGPNIDASVLGKIPREWPASSYEDRCLRFHNYRPEEPFMQLMVSDSERWYDVADRLTDVIDNLVKEYYTLLKPGPDS